MSDLPPSTPGTIPVLLTENAAKRIAELASEEKEPGAMLRIAVEGGGCSGFQYRYDMVFSSEPDDVVIQKNGAALVIDTVSLPFLEGATVDFVETLGSAMFVITNPNASANCGCGNSFAV